MNALENISETFRSRPLALEFKFASADEGVIEGYASTFGAQDLQGHVIDQGAFSASLAGHAAQGTAPAMLWAHDFSRPVGRWTSLSEDARGLRATGRLNLATSDGREAFAHVKGGSVSGLSIGWSADPKTIRQQGDALHFSKVNLFEVSLTPLPANTEARVTGVKSIGSASELEELLRGAGLARSAAKKIVAAGFKGLAGADEDELLIALLERSAQRWKDF